MEDGVGGLVGLSSGNYDAIKVKLSGKNNCIFGLKVTIYDVVLPQFVVCNVICTWDWDIFLVFWG